jgi:transglutaminase-like putative cysteine protease
MKQFLLLIVLLPFLGVSQDFSEADYLYLKRHEYIQVDLENQAFHIEKTVSESAQFQTAKKLYFSNESIYYDSFTEVKDIEAYTFHPDTKKRTDVDYIETKRAFDNGVFYSDQESKNFIFPAVKKGAITHLNYKEVIKDPHFMGLFRFGTFVPTKEAKLSVEFPKNVTIGYIDFHTDDIPINFTQEQKGNKMVYTWSIDNIRGFQGEDDSEEPLYFLPHIIVYIKSYTHKGKTHRVLNDVKDLYRWYNSLVERVDAKNLNTVYKIAEEVTKDLNTKHDKAEAIFNWVQDNITYVAFEDGLGGFIPRGAASVCDKRYGDCKDMANLLYEMLNHVGIDAYRTWIGTRNRPYSYYEVPTPMVDNHMITAAVIEKDTIFLDATDSYVPYGMPSGFTQTKEALIGIDATNFEIVTVPTQAADKSVSKITSEIRLENGHIKVKEKRLLSGYEKVDMVSDYTYKKADKTEEEFLNTTLALGNNKTTYTNITKAYFDNSKTPLELSYDLTIANYAKQVGNKTFINLNIDKTLSKSKIDAIETRKYSKKIDYKFEKDYKATFIIPEGYQLNSLPKDLSFEHPNYSFKINYTQEGSKIIQHKHIKINTLSIQKPEFESWNAFIKSLIKAYKKSITIEQIS